MSSTTEAAIENIKKNALQPQGDTFSWNAQVEDDMDGEQEAMPPAPGPDKPASKRGSDDIEDSVQDDVEDVPQDIGFKTLIQQASKGVTEKTHDEYLR